MIQSHPSGDNNFQWQPQPEAWQAIEGLVDRLATSERWIESLATRMLSETGTRLIDWVTEIRLPDDGTLRDNLLNVGFETCLGEDAITLRNRDGMFPTVRFEPQTEKPCLTIKADRIDDFCVAMGIVHDATDRQPSDGLRSRRAVVYVGAACDLAVGENHGKASACSDQELASRIATFRKAFDERYRPVHGHESQQAFETTIALLKDAVEKLGSGLACDQFFQSERVYWQNRNHAASVQKKRQDVLGLGWANHDHHTYRSSRVCFHRVIEALEVLGFTCRERFYAGAQAGWGAQVLEQSEAGVIVFADVDLSPDEVAGDFAHQPLPDLSELGTVGLWCRLHGEAFLAAGMHHLECQFAFDAVRSQLASAGVPTMEPFTDFPFLRQAFTTAEIWPVDPWVLRNAVADGVITAAQAERFEQTGASGSHLEILERNDGYKGFNQTGISDIIQRTDPRNPATA
ncbi:hypothetical protein Poly24_31830 [Rosistilla carotiformis]|uniref:Uncharacterized protein n=1 Tax=Rosistilla carotiformis TaxID=2528017 RepID=A0A518JVA5_9BACT|nr:hypothetical protein [Rosistilla carotiformis]QDV69467.1 hypothetical protein Poly24_31830 [Rosistilla carotiformis]